MYTLADAISLQQIEKGYKSIISKNSTKAHLIKINNLLKLNTPLPNDLIPLCLDYFSVSYEIEIYSGNIIQCYNKVRIILTGRCRG